MTDKAVLTFAAAMVFLLCGAPAATLAYPAAATDAYAVPGSAVHEMKGPAGRVYDLYVKTPPGYDRAENADREYPVIFVNDGDLFFMTAAGAVLLPIYNGAMRPVIVVGVSYAKGEDGIASRQRDFTPVEVTAWTNATGGAQDYLNWMRDSVVPFVDDHYRTDASQRTLAGHSLGGTFAAFVMFKEPALFTDYVILSPALWYGDHAIAGFEARYADDHDDLAARVFLATGDLEGPKGGLKTIDMVGDMNAFALRLKSRNYPGLVVRDLVLEGGVNHGASFPGGFALACDWLFSDR